MFKNAKKCFSISLLYLFLVPFFVQAQVVRNATTETKKAIEVNIAKSGNAYQINDLNVVVEVFPYTNDYKIYKGKMFNGTVISFLGKTIGYFALPGGLLPTLCGEGVNPITKKPTKSCGEMSSGKITLPYFTNGKYADIYDLSGKKVLNIDLTSKATCNENGVCEQPKEDSINCPSDCTQKQPVVQKPVIAPQVQTLPQKSWTQNVWPYLALGITLLILAGGITYAIVYFRRKNE